MPCCDAEAVGDGTGDSQRIVGCVPSAELKGRRSQERTVIVRADSNPASGNVLNNVPPSGSAQSNKHRQNRIRMFPTENMGDIFFCAYRRTFSGHSIRVTIGGFPNGSHFFCGEQINATHLYWG